MSPSTALLRRFGMLSLIFVVVGTLLGSHSAVAATPAARLVLTTTGSPFDPAAGGQRNVVAIEVKLPAPGSVTLTVHDFDGRRLRYLARDLALDSGTHGWRWNGRDGKRRLVAYGPYRVRVTFDPDSGPAVRRSRWVTRAARVPYPQRPAAVMVALDPGHGGPAGGATWRGLVEDDVNLDIGLRLEAMLRGAGVGVVMTRRTDRNVSRVGLDLSGDGHYTRTDELIARNDIANIARADVHIAIHNNASSCHCTRGTAMYTHNRRNWSPEGRRLAWFVLDDHLRHLRRLSGYRPRNRGVRFHPFKALKPFNRRAMPRPSLQPSILGESLFVDWPSEKRILGRKSGRTIVAAAYFDGISRYLAWRRHGLRYDILDAPKVVPGGKQVSVRMRLTNRGHSTSASWVVSARLVRAVQRYDGRPRRGKIRARVAIPDGLGPGESVEVVVPGITMPPRPGRWLVKLDVDMPGGDHMSTHGVVGPQLHVRTFAP